MPSTVFLRASLKRWQWRLHYRQDHLQLAVERKDDRAVTKWHRLVADADRMVKHREAQLHARSNRKQVVWMPGARKLPRSSAGGWAVDCPAKGVLHTTEGSGDATPTLDANGDHPHFQVEQNGRITQYIPVDESAKALKHVGSPETNRAHAIQIEVCGFAAKPAWPAEQQAAVRKVMRFIEANAGVQRASHVKFVKTGSQRLSGPEWIRLSGWCGHQHVPENDHTDPGAIKIAGLL